MASPTLLLARFDEIAASLAQRDSALALLALGSVGAEHHRLDEYSDLDFFAVVRADVKQAYLDAIDWLEAAHPVAWSFKNTRDGRKALFADGIFAEYAVFTEAEMADAHYAPGRIVWARGGFDRALCVPKHTPPTGPRTDRDWIIGEALSNLYIGLARFRRGEKLAAARLVQVYAVDRVAELIALDAPEREAGRDPYAIDRRFEARHPQAEALLAQLMPGYDRTPEAALAILSVIEARATVEPTLRSEILRLAAPR